MSIAADKNSAEPRAPLYPELLHLTPASTLADLPHQDFQVKAATIGQEVSKEFDRRPDLAGAMIFNDAGHIGMISRHNFFKQML